MPNAKRRKTTVKKEVVVKGNLTFEELMKKALNTPIPKKGEKDENKNVKK